jgi:adhesin transport system outer membrane protein
VRSARLGRGPRRLLAGAVAAAVALASGPGAAQTLRDAVRAALTDNPAARASNAEVKAAALELLQLREEFLPRLDLRAGLGGAYYDDPGRLDPDENEESTFDRSVSLEAEYTLFDGYRRANRVYRRAAALDGSILTLLDASETLGLSAVRAYVDVVRHIDLLAVADENIATHEEIKRRVDELVAGGRQPVSAAFEVEERLLSARLARLDVLNALADARVRFEAVVGRMPGEGLAVPRVTGLPGSREALVAAAVRNSYRARAAATRIAERRFEKAVREGERLPQVSLRAGVEQGWDRFGTEGEEFDASVGIALEWELYTGGRKAQSGALTERARIAQARRDEIVREVQEFAGEVWNAYQTGIERVLLLEVQRQAARNVVVQYREEFLAGTRTLIDVLDAERSFFNVRFEEVSARAALDFAGYRMLAAQSGLARHFDIEPADIPLAPGFVAFATDARLPSAVFDTEIRALE